MARKQFRKLFQITTQPVLTCSNLTIKTREECETFVQS